MANLGSITKQPREILPVDLSYAAVIGARTVETITPTIEVPTGMTATVQQITGSVLQIYISGGTDGQTYKWTVLTDIVIGGRTTRVEDEFTVNVVEV